MLVLVFLNFKGLVSVQIQFFPLKKHSVPVFFMVVPISILTLSFKLD
jgi:hypothetical protein